MEEQVINIDPLNFVLEKAKEKVADQKEKLKQALKEKGYLFSDEKAFDEFCKSQLKVKTKKGKTYVKHEGKTLITFK